MKTKALFTFLLALASINCGFGQLKHFGVKLAVTSADLVYHIESSEDLPTLRRVGFCVGAFAEWFEHSPITLMTQVEYVQKGMGMDVASGYSSGDVVERTTEYSRLDYLSVPILGKATLPAGSLSPYFLAGPRVDFFLGYTTDQTGFPVLYDQFKKTVLGATLGAGLQIDALLSIPIVIEARYNLDITNSFEGEVVKVHNDSFDLWLGVAI
jgi:hypothetical protein